MRRSRSPASSCYTASASDSSHCDVSAFKAELHLQSGTRCFGPEHRTAKQGLSARAGYLHQSRRIDVLVKNAAIVQYEAVHEVDLESWNRALAVNLTGVMLGMRAVIPGMLAQGGGCIVNR